MAPLMRATISRSEKQNAFHTHTARPSPWRATTRPPRSARIAHTSVSVPYWEWDEARALAQSEQYLRLEAQAGRVAGFSDYVELIDHTLRDAR